MKMNKIYLDHAATTPVMDEVLEEMMPYFKQYWYNPNSVYLEAKRPFDVVESARENIARKMGAKPSEIYFTSGGSESNNWAIQGFVNCWTTRGYTPVVITSRAEHDSVLDCVYGLTCEVALLNVDSYGTVKPNVLEQNLCAYDDEEYKVLVSIQMRNNEIGSYNDIKRLYRLCKQHGAILHTDAVQAFAEQIVHADVADMISMSGHKIGAPKGIGFLYKKDNVDIYPLIYGDQNSFMRGGTENVPYIAGLSKAFDVYYDKVPSIDDYMRLSFTLFDAMKSMGIDFEIVSHQSGNIQSITIKHDVTANALIHLLDASGIQISAGSACNARYDVPSHVLKAIGLRDEDIYRTIRVSFGISITVDDIKTFVNELAKAIEIISGKKLEE